MCDLLRKWCNFKKEINTKPRKLPYVKEREVWWFSLGVNVGHELNGKGGDFSRPCVVLRKINKYTVLVLPLTSIDKKHSPHHFHVGNLSGKCAYAVLSQARVVDLKRVLNKEGIIAKGIFNQLKHEFKRYFKL